MNSFSWKIFVLSLLVTGCAQMCEPEHEKMRAEEVLESYLDAAFNMEDLSERDVLLKYTSGKLQGAIAGASDETLKEAYIDREYHLHAYELLQREDLTPRETKLTYRLDYQELDQNEDLKNIPFVSTTNVVLMMRSEGKWLIHDILENTTTIDFPLESKL